MTVFLYAIEARDLLWDRLTELCGARLTSNYVPHRRRRARRAGRLDREDAADARRVDGAASTRSTSCSRRNRIFVDRTRGTGVVSREDALDLGFTGPVPARVAASRTTSARRRRTSSTTGSTSTSRSARTATTSTAT